MYTTILYSEKQAYILRQKMKILLDVTHLSIYHLLALHHLHTA